MPNLTLMDWTKRVDPNGSTAVIANLLSQTNHILKDAIYVEGNLPTGHRVTIATGLPTVYFRSLNEGVPTSKAATAQVDEPISMVEAWSETDVDLAILNGNKASFMMTENAMFIESMNQRQATEMFYGNPATDSRSYLGLAPRYSSTSAGNGQNVILSSGTVANKQTSVWLICWSESTVFAIFPKGSKAGLLHENLGTDTVQTLDSNGIPNGRMRAIQHRYQWKTGIVVKDWRYAVRICNIGVNQGSGTEDINDLEGAHAPTGSVNNILHLLAKAIGRIPNPQRGRCGFYLNRTVFTALMRVALERGASSGLLIQQAAREFGTPGAELSFLGIPIRQCDAILNTEAVVA